MERLGHDAENTPIVCAIVTLAHALGLDVTAEGIETDEQLINLRALHCDRAQGYYFSKPLPGEDIEELLTMPAPHMQHTARLLVTAAPV